MVGEGQIGKAYGQDVQQSVVDVGVELLGRGVRKRCKIRSVRKGRDSEEGGNEALVGWHVWIRSFIKDELRYTYMGTSLREMT